AQIDELDGKIKQLEQAQEKIAKAINDMKRSQDLDNPSVRQVFEGLVTKSKQLGQAIADQHTHAKQLQLQGKQGAVLEVVIFQEIWTGTQVTLGEFKTMVRATIQKPRIAQLRATRVRILPMGEGNKPVD
nr:hypothetical protein [Candidatus Krumholzibacteria bacterium]